MIAVIILFVGIAAAITIYLTAQPIASNPLGYEPEDSKQYLRELEVYGGKANVLATELRLWLVSLWHGRRLAFTVAFLTLAFAGGFWFVGTRTPIEEDESERPFSRDSDAP